MNSRKNSGRFVGLLLRAAAMFVAACVVLVDPLLADTPTRTQRTIQLEVFTRGDSELCKQAVDYAANLAQRTPGLEVKVHDILADRQQLSRIWKLAKSSGRDKPVVPAFRCCNRMYYGFTSPQETGPRIEDLYTAHVYTRDTCPRCRAAKAFLWKLGADWPALRFRIYEVTQDAAARQRWQEICRNNNQLPGLPTTLFAGRVIVGYQGDDITGKEYQRLLERVSRVEPEPIVSKPVDASLGMKMPGAWFPLSMVTVLQPPQAEDPVPQSPNFEDVPLPEEAAPEDIGEAELNIEPESTSEGSEPGDIIVVPFLGELRVSRLGLPLFTFLVGLVDGFNPCAMWVLVFLLSVLVNIKDRRKILLIAGTFVVVSGLAYYTFMAAWLNLFMLIGMARWIQIVLGVMAITIGLVNVKDFFAFKHGISFSIPESSKPGIYARVRSIVSAKYMTAALMSVVVLAVLVNIVELFCTAGLPAMYTQILTMHELPAWKNYSYLGLYISAYMLDDTVLLSIVVATLSHRKLQEREGRWLKLVSGLVILALGAVMIFKPGWLQLGH